MLVFIAALAAAGPYPVWAQALPEAEAVEEMQRALQQLEANIGDFRRRVEELERRVNAPSQPTGQTGAASPPSAEVKPEAPAPPAPGLEEEAATAAPGQFEVDEEAIDRALERALIQTGALLLQPGRAEVEPSFSYERRESDAPQLIVQGGGIAAAANELERNELEAGLTLRLGLPFASQVEVEVPYRYEKIDNVQRVNFAFRGEDERDAAGFGDVSISFAKELLREQGLLPNLIGRVQWDSDTGENKDGVSLGSGFHEITGSLTATKRQDPLVFVGSAFYTSSLEDDDVRPGDEFGFSLGTVLAASPETSLRFFLAQSFSSELEVDDQDIEGSDQVSSSLILGASSIIAPRVLLDITAGVGLTEDAPDYSINVSIPIRFNVPFLF